MNERVNYNSKTRTTVNHPVIKTIQPKEYGLIVNGESGRIIQTLEDGYCLVEFDNLFVKEEKLYFKNRNLKTPLNWYVHKSDLT